MSASNRRGGRGYCRERTGQDTELFASRRQQAVNIVMIRAGAQCCCYGRYHGIVRRHPPPVLGSPIKVSHLELSPWYHESDSCCAPNNCLFLSPVILVLARRVPTRSIYLPIFVDIGPGTGHASRERADGRCGVSSVTHKLRGRGAGPDLQRVGFHASYHRR